MLIGKGEVLTYIVERCLEQNLTNRRTMIGSTLGNDENQ